MIRAAVRALIRPRPLRPPALSWMPVLRPATEADAPALAAILSDWIDATPWMPRRHSRLEERGFVLRLIREMTVTVAMAPGATGGPARPRGFLARRDGFIHALYLAPQARRRGLGRRLLDAAKAEAPALELWVFQANAPARAFYRAQGFAEAESGDGSGNDEGLPDLRLVWQRAATGEAEHG